MRLEIRSISDMGKAVNAFRKRSDEIVKAAVGELVHEVILSTPIDTTRLVSNWQVTLDAPAQGEVAGAWFATGAKAEGVTGEHAAWTAATSNATRALDRLRVKDTQSVWITNNVPYANDVEFYGSSKGYSVAGPAMMVRGPIQDWGKMVERAAK